MNFAEVEPSGDYFLKEFPPDFAFDVRLGVSKIGFVFVEGYMDKFIYNPRKY